MTTLNQKDISNLAHLARLSNNFTNGDLAEDLNKIVGMIDFISQVNTNSVEPMSHPGNNSQRLREDVVSEEDQSQELLALGAEAADNMFIVPKVVE